MHKKESEFSLQDAILQLEIKQADEGKLVREQFNLAFDSIKPINIIKSTLKEAAESQDLKNNIFNTSVGLTAGYLSKVLFVGVSHNPIKKLLGAALLFGVTNIVAKNPEVVKSLAKRLLKFRNIF